MKNIFIILSIMFSSVVFAFDNVIDSGDIIKISVYGNPDLTTEVKVSEKGAVNFPLIGGVVVAGITVVKAEKKIAQRLIKGGFLRLAQVNIIVLKSSGKQVSVLGKVDKPGKYSIESGAKTLFDFIAISGGVSAKGSDVVTIIRTSKTPTERISINVDELLLNSSVEQIDDANIEMQAGDVIYVPEAPVFYVYGEANEPGMYRFKHGMTVAQAISSAGGVSARGTEKGLKVKRSSEFGKIVDLKVNLSTVIMAKDVIFIKESLF